MPRWAGLKKDFNEIFNNASFVKTMGNVRSRIRIHFIKNDNGEEVITQLSKLNFSGTQ